VQVVVAVIAMPLTMMLNGIGAFGVQLIASAVVLAIIFPLKLFLAHSIGVPGVPLGTAVAHLVAWVIPMAFFVRRRFWTKAAGPLEAGASA
jgi:hypothetical protein